jgi:hypothetical protein
MTSPEVASPDMTSPEVVNGNEREIISRGFFIRYFPGFFPELL